LASGLSGFVVKRPIMAGMCSGANYSPHSRWCGKASPLLTRKQKREKQGQGITISFKAMPPIT
jgi:hypothetical protein